MKIISTTQTRTKIHFVIKNAHEEVYQGKSYLFNLKMKTRKTWLWVRVIY